MNHKFLQILLGVALITATSLGSVGSVSAQEGSTNTLNDPNHDGCTEAGQVCICSNTQWKGTCNTGPVHTGLYCHCSNPHHHPGFSED